MDRVELVRERFIEGLEVRSTEVKSTIYDSWRRSKSYGVCTDSLPASNLVQPDELRNYLFSQSKDPQLNEFVKVVQCFDFITTLYNDKGDLQHIINYSGNYENDFKAGIVFLKNASEAVAGTNSTGIALHEKTACMVIGPEHYNHAFKEYSCVASPLYNKHGELLGTVNISLLHTNASEDTLKLVMSFARIYESLYSDANKKQKGNPYLKANETTYTFEDVWTRDHGMLELIQKSKNISKYEVPVILLGESGVGKEVFAQSIHNYSERKGNFVGINCGAIPTELLESELFGYEKGAFTGAKGNGKTGLIEHASGGTLFLDEIESMTLNAQVKLLRVLSTKSLIRIGGVKPIPVDLRIIASTKDDLLERSKDGSFREDLYYRLNVIVLSIPPLRWRGNDVEYIARTYINQFARAMAIEINSCSEEFFRALGSYRWPGNIRELKNIIERAVIFAENGAIHVNQLPDNIKKTYFDEALVEILSNVLETDRASENVLEKMEQIVIERVLIEEKGNITKSASRLGISRPKLYRKIDQYVNLQGVMKRYKIEQV